MARMSVGAVVLFFAGCGTRDPSEDLRYPKVTMAIVARADVDHDRRISEEEYYQVAFPDEPMDRWDRDQDGSLDPSEVEDAFRHADPTRIQAEGRREVYQRFGNPFGEAVESDGNAGRPSSAERQIRGSATERDDKKKKPQKSSRRNRRER
jgi:hypothetical protein